MKSFTRARSGGAKRTCLWVLAAALLSSAAAAEPLTLPAALSRTAQADLTAKATQERLKGAAGALRQAGVRPNPTLGFQMGNVMGSAPYGGVDDAETTLSYQQPLERGKKAQARIRLASAEAEVIEAEGRLRTLDVMADAATVWVQAVAAQAEAGLAQERLDLALQAQGDIARRVNAARDPLFAGALADADVAAAKIARDQARHTAAALKVQLASFWQGAPDFELDPDWLNDLDVADPVAFESPDIARLRALMRASQARIKVETSKGVQDPTLEAGVRHFNGDRAVAFVLGGSIPLGLYDTNTGAIARAKAEAQAAAIDIEAAERITAREIAALTQQLTALAEDVRRSEAEVIPSAKKAVALVRAGFQRGGFTYRDVIAAQDALMATKTRRIAALKTFHLNRIRHERLAGRWLPLLPTEDPKS